MTGPGSVTRVCVVGGGGREHTLRDCLARTPGTQVVVTPGNPGIPGSVATPAEEVDADLFVVGPEALLVDGLADRLRAEGRLVFGPGADGARLEGSKAWMKELLVDAGVPTARHATFTEPGPALAFLRTLPGPYVVKTDGLAAGKGVCVTDSLGDAEADVRAKLAGTAFGAAGRRVVIEEHLDGPELSVLCVCDGTRAVPLAPAQDFKRLGDGDAGPNTGGMGAYSPVPLAGADLVAQVLEQAVAPTLGALRRRGIDYRGVLYAGLMLTSEGPKVLEYNVRFGDPEAQAVLPRFAGDMVALLAEAAAGRLRSEATWSKTAAVTVVLASSGYPSQPRLGDVISGLEEARGQEGVSIGCAGVARDDQGRLVTAGGRVLNVTGVGDDLAQARGRAYAAIDHVSWPGMQYRGDIGERAASDQNRRKERV